MKYLIAIFALSLISVSATSVPDYDVGKNKSELAIVHDADVNFEYSFTATFEFEPIVYCAIECANDFKGYSTAKTVEPELKAYKTNVVKNVYRNPRDAI